MREIDREANIVLLGAFNPTIFNPDWLLKNSLISESDRGGAAIKVIHTDIALFELKWCVVEVRQEKFIARTKDPAYYGPLRDLVLGIFMLLEHTPINAIGINSVFTFAMDNADQWHSVGDRLVPKDLWSKYLTGRVGMRRVSVNSDRDDQYAGKVNITIAPLDNIPNGVLVDFNSHIDVNGDMGIVREVLAGNWESIQDDAEDIVIGMLNDAGK